jgi:type I restriction enzyme S subunit
MLDGWVETKLVDAVEVLDRLRKPINSTEREGRQGSVPYYGANGQAGWIDDSIFNEELVLLGEDAIDFVDPNARKAYLISGPSWVNNHAHVLRAKPEKVYSFFLAESLNKVDYSQYVSFGTRSKLTQGSMNGIKVLLPPLPEQKRIVDLISSVDSYIGALQQQLKSARRSRNAVLHEFMNGEGTAFEDTQLGQIAKFLNGKAYSKEELLTVGKYRVLRVGNFFSNNNWYWSDLELEPNKYCENGDLLYAWSASFGPRIWNEEKVIYHYHIWKVNPDESLVDKKWLFYWLEDDVERIKSASGSGSIMMHVTKSEMEKRAIRLPALSEQIRQLVILESFDQNIHTLETLIVSTSHLRSSMLSDLLSGIHEIPASYDKVMGAV